MPELVGLAAQGEPVICWHHLSVRADGAENHEMRACALRTNLGHFRRPEAARKSQLKLVRHFLVAKNQNRMFLESSARRGIGRIVRGDIGKGQTAQFGCESRPQWKDFHRRVLLILCCNVRAKLPDRQSMLAALPVSSSSEAQGRLLFDAKANRIRRSARRCRSRKRGRKDVL